MSTTDQWQELANTIKRWGREAGFQHIGITDTALQEHEAHLQTWLDQGFQADMNYMASHGNKRSRPEELVPGTRRVISFRMDYLPADTRCLEVLNNPEQGYLSRYALGRDYHKLIRKRLAVIAGQIEIAAGGEHRAFVDSAPVLERALAVKAGLGWIGKNTMLIHPKAGSWFFLGEIYTSLPLPVDQAFNGHHCGSCRACLQACPTNAFKGPGILDAGRCISYLTIENKGAIPETLRPLMGNRIYGCDDCQLVCPWNKFSTPTREADFQPRHGLDQASLLTLFAWSEAEFLRYTEGSAIRRIGYESWLRNIAVALGNGAASPEAIHALTARATHPSALVREHVAWALQQLTQNP